jgi:hypothetical protein
VQASLLQAMLDATMQTFVDYIHETSNGCIVTSQDGCPQMTRRMQQRADDRTTIACKRACMHRNGDRFGATDAQEEIEKTPRAKHFFIAHDAGFLARQAVLLS